MRWLSLGECAQVNQQFSCEEMSLLKDFATHAEIALKNARLFLEKEQAMHVLEQAETEKSALLVMVKALSQDLHLNSVVREIMRQAKTLLRCDIASMYTIDYDTNEMLTFTFNGNEERRISLEHGLAARCAKTGEVINLEDAYESPDFNKEVDLQTGYRSKGMLCMPVISSGGHLKGRAIAVIQAMNKLDGGPFNDKDISLLQDFTAHAQIALRNATRFERVNSRYQLALGKGDDAVSVAGKSSVPYNTSEQSDDDDGCNEQNFSVKEYEVEEALAKVHAVRQLEAHDVADAEEGSRAALAEQNLLMQHLEQQERRLSRGTTSRPESMSGRIDVIHPRTPSIDFDDDEDGVGLNSDDEYPLDGFDEDHGQKNTKSATPPTSHANSCEVRGLPGGSVAQGGFA